MPCYQVTRMTQDLGRWDRELFKRTLDALDLRAQYDTETYTTVPSLELVINWRTRKATFPTYSQEAFGQLRREYSIQTLKEVSKRKGWKSPYINRLSSAQRSNKLTLTRR